MTTNVQFPQGKIFVPVSSHETSISTGETTSDYTLFEGTVRKDHTDATGYMRYTNWTKQFIIVGGGELVTFKHGVFLAVPVMSLENYRRHYNSMPIPNLPRGARYRNYYILPTVA